MDYKWSATYVCSNCRHGYHKVNCIFDQEKRCPKCAQFNRPLKEVSSFKVYFLKIDRKFLFKKNVIKTLRFIFKISKF